MAQCAEDSDAGKWIDLVNASSAFRFTRRHFVVRIEDPGVAARDRVQRGQVFRARQELTGAAFAPETAKTLAELRRRRPQAEIQEIPLDMIEFQPVAPLNLDPKIFHLSVRGTSRSCAKSGRLHERNARRHRNHLLAVPCSGGPGQKGSAGDCEPPFGVGYSYSSREETWGESEASPLARPFSQNVEKHALRFSMRYPPEPEPTALDTLSERQPRLTVLTIEIGAYDHAFRTAYCQNCWRCRLFAICYRLPESHTRNQARTCGRTQSACGTTSNNMRMANKVTPSCQCCSVSVCTMRWKRCNKSWIPGSFFSCTTTTCSFCHRLGVHVKSSTSWRTHR